VCFYIFFFAKPWFNKLGYIENAIMIGTILVQKHIFKWAVSSIYNLIFKNVFDYMEDSSTTIVMLWILSPVHPGFTTFLLLPNVDNNV
jgi:hypothetical protein